MERAPGSRVTADETAGAPPVVWAVLQHLTDGQGLQDFTEADVLLDHLLMRVLGDPQVSGTRLRPYPVQLVAR